MYLRISQRVNADGTRVRYLSLAESLWDPEQHRCRTRVIHNFGREDRLDPQVLARLARSLGRWRPPPTRPLETLWRDLGWAAQTAALLRRLGRPDLPGAFLDLLLDRPTPREAAVREALRQFPASYPSDLTASLPPALRAAPWLRTSFLLPNLPQSPLHLTISSAGLPVGWGGEPLPNGVTVAGPGFGPREATVQGRDAQPHEVDPRGSCQRLPGGRQLRVREEGRWLLLFDPSRAAAAKSRREALLADLDEDLESYFALPDRRRPAALAALRQHPLYGPWLTDEGPPRREPAKLAAAALGDGWLRLDCRAGDLPPAELARGYLELLASHHRLTALPARLPQRPAHQTVAERWRGELLRLGLRLCLERLADGSVPLRC